MEGYTGAAGRRDEYGQKKEGEWKERKTEGRGEKEWEIRRSGVRKGRSRKGMKWMEEKTRTGKER